MSNKTILVITDGIGHNTSNYCNAFSKADTPTYDYLFKNVPHSLIHTYGKYVGLPQNQMGNSEVGHMAIGSGRILYQDLVKINSSIENNNLKDNTVLINTLNTSNNIHLFGLLSDGGVHSHINHIISIAKIAKEKGKKVFIHGVTDGRDVAYNSARKYIEQILNICDNTIKLATLSGRYYALDRDNRWDRIQLAYNTIALGENQTNLEYLDFLDNSYKNETFDEFLLPTSFNSYNGIKPNDGIIFCNFRSDRMREISSAFGNKNFNNFNTIKLNINIATMTCYDKNLPLPVIFPKEKLTNTLASIISNANLNQLHTAETEKYAHVTFFLNGGVEEPVLNETRILIPSPKVKTYDLKPQMSANEITDVVLKAIDQKYDFIVINYANGDMVGHTGIFEAAVEAVECVDKQLKKIIDYSNKNNYNLIITSDHGNCEKMKDENGEILTKHTAGDVYCFGISKKIKELKNGSLSNIAPSILKLMELNIPKEMDQPLF